MKLTIEDKKKKDIFIYIFHLLKNCSSQINATFNTDHLHIQGMDKSHICLFNLTIHQSWFDSYIVNDKEDICFDSTIFYSMISTKGDDQSLNIRKITNETLIIELFNGTTNKTDYNKYFTMQLLEYDYTEMVIPTVDYDAEMHLPSKKISDTLSQLNNYGDDINIKCTDDFVDFITKGTSGEMRVNIPIDDMISYAVVEDEVININYSLIYINKMCMTNKISSTVEFSISNEVPMKIKYSLGDDVNNSELVFYIAPKLSDDE
jgi:proliferating cell nuclear antigen PCNA